MLFCPDTFESCSVANLLSLGNTLARVANNSVLATVIHQIFVNWKECAFLTKAGQFFSRFSLWWESQPASDNTENVCLDTAVGNGLRVTGESSA